MEHEPSRPGFSTGYESCPPLGTAAESDGLYSAIKPRQAGGPAAENP